VYGVLFISALTVAFPANWTFTTKHLDYLSANSLSLRNTLVYGGVAAIICALFAMLLGFLVQRRDWRGKNIVDFIAIMPAAIPGIFFGIGYATAFNQRWLDWIDRGALITISLPTRTVKLLYGLFLLFVAVRFFFF
jgi:iron(III) transport system permease protein